MMKLLANIALSAALSVSVLGALPGSLSAQDLEFRIGPDGVRPVTRDRDRDRYYRRGCSPGEARAAAREEGFRRPEVVRVTDRSVTVEGWTRNGPDRIRFANRPGCPII